MKDIEKQNNKYLEEMKGKHKVYLVVTYARPCVRDYVWTGKMIVRDNSVEPEVYHFTDHNGTLDEWYKCPITDTTTGFIYTWTFDEYIAHRLVNMLKEDLE